MGGWNETAKQPLEREAKTGIKIGGTCEARALREQIGSLSNDVLERCS